MLIINKKTLALDHLREIHREVTIELPGNIKKTINVVFRFSNHCYSRMPKKGESIPTDLLVKDGSVHQPRDRIYDQLRYELSFSLVKIIDGIIATNAEVTRSKYNNFFHVSCAAIEGVGNVGQSDYYIFMSAEKVAEPNRPRYVSIFVETAHPKDVNDPKPGHDATRPFGVMLGEYWAPSKR